MCRPLVTPRSCLGSSSSPSKASKCSAHVDEQQLPDSGSSSSSNGQIILRIRLNVHRLGCNQTFLLLKCKNYMYGLCM
jgi:hypothetical protein